jgi:phosphatidate cytidylyltransferase
MKRIATALLLIPLITFAILGGYSWVFLAVSGIVALLCYHEFGGIAAAHGLERPGPLGYAVGLLILYLPDQNGMPLTLAILLTLSFLGLALRADDLGKALPYAATHTLGVLYIFGAWRCAIGLYLLNPYWLLFTLIVNWAGDSAAYYIGRQFGKRRLAPRVSPGKSMEGAAASLAAGVAAGALFLRYSIPDFPVWAGLGLAAVGNIAGQVGDLAESALKRGAGLKDSGTLLPGHGGWLDRVDSTLFSLPVVYALVLAINGLRLRGI